MVGECHWVFISKFDTLVSGVVAYGPGGQIKLDHLELKSLLNCNSIVGPDLGKMSSPLGAVVVDLPYPCSHTRKSIPE